MRAYFVEKLCSKDAAECFGYSAGAFGVLCHQFRHDPDKGEFFRTPRRGPRSAPARDAVRELAVAMRKRNMSVYDIQREWAAASRTISVNALSVVSAEEGFSRLPRRRDDERPAALKPEPAAIADARQLDLSPRSFRTAVAGLFVFVPLLQHLDLERVAAAGKLPSSKMIPAACALRTLLALKLLGKERKQLTLMACSPYRMLANKIGRECARAQPKTLFRNLLDLGGAVTIDPHNITVRLDELAHDPYLLASGIRGC